MAGRCEIGISTQNLTWININYNNWDFKFSPNHYFLSCFFLPCQMQKRGPPTRTLLSTCNIPEIWQSIHRPQQIAWQIQGFQCHKSTKALSDTDLVCRQIEMLQELEMTNMLDLTNVVAVQIQGQDVWLQRDVLQAGYTTVNETQFCGI